MENLTLHIYKLVYLLHKKIKCSPVINASVQIRLLLVVVAFYCCFFITDSRADTYPASHEYYASVSPDGTPARIEIGPLVSFSEAAQLAWDYFDYSYFWPMIKVDWYADRISPMCQTKMEPDFTGIALHIEIWSSTLNTENGLTSCTSTFHKVRIQHICPYGGHPGFTLHDGNICYGAPSCDDYKIRNPNTGKCEVLPKNAGQQCEIKFKGNPVNISTGNKYQQQVDYQAVGVFPLTVSRSYNSDSDRWRLFPKIDGINAETSVTMIRPDGKAFPFANNGGTWDSDPDVVEALASTEDSSGNVTDWTYTTRNGQIETYDSEGRILSVTDRSGLSHTYSYQTDSITVTHSNGDTLVYQLDSGGRVTGFTDPDNRYYQYSYDSESRLVHIIFPDDTQNDSSDNPKRIYHYEDSNFPHALTGITDENGNRYATWAYDEDGRAISSEHANGVDKTTLTYNADGTTTVTNPLGKQTTYHFTTIQGVRKVTQVEGHPTASCEGANKSYSYDVNGNVISKTDWNGVTTTYTYDMDRNLELSRTEAEGTPQERTITTEWHPQFRLPTKITEPNRITEYTYDAQGRQLSHRVGGI